MKSWLAEEPEPGWTASFDLSKIDTLAKSGKIGLVANHLHGANQYIAFGDLSITPVTTP